MLEGKIYMSKGNTEKNFTLHWKKYFTSLIVPLVGPNHHLEPRNKKRIYFSSLSSLRKVEIELVRTSAFAF